MCLVLVWTIALIRVACGPQSCGLWPGGVGLALCKPCVSDPGQAAAVCDRASCYSLSPLMLDLRFGLVDFACREACLPAKDGRPVTSRVTDGAERPTWYYLVMLNEEQWIMLATCW